MVSSTNRLAFWASIGVAALIVLPLALHVPLYFDDLGRSLNGSYGWSEDGRPLADIVSQLLLMGAPRTVLTSPLGLLVCLPAMAWTSLLLTRVFQHPRPWAAPLACTFLFGSPYFIENLSYSFDAPQMVLAVLLNVWGAWCMLQQTRFQPWRWVGSVGLVLAGLCLYQAAHAAFWIPVLMALVFADRTQINTPINQQSNKQPKPPTKSELGQRRFWPVLLGSFAALAMALLLYRGLVLPLVQLDAYADNFDAVAGVREVPLTVLRNLGALLNQFEQDWWDSAIAELLVAFVVLTAIVSARRASQSRWGFLARLILVPLVLMGSTGVALLLNESIIPPRALIGVGVVFACLALSASRGWPAARSLSRPGRALQGVVIGVVLAMAWGCLSISYFYGQAHAAQERMNRDLMVAVVRDLRSGGYGPGDLRQLQIEGRSALAPITRNTLRSYPHLRRMVRPVVPIAVDWQGHVRLKKHGYRPMKPSSIPLNQAIDWSVSRPLYGLDVRGSHLTLRLPG
jgi:hypothetical protein